MSEESVPQDFRLALAQQVFEYTVAAESEKTGLQAKLTDALLERGLVAFYERLCAEHGWAPDAGRTDAARSANAQQLAELEAKIADAQENLGETEVRDALLAKAQFLARTGERDAAAAAFAAAEEKTASSGTKADMLFEQTRLAIMYGDWHGVRKLLGRAKAVCEAGGDWERKNKLKVYEGAAALHSRDFKRAAELLLESIATFTASELFDYTRCVSYAALAALVTLDRVSLAQRVVDSPEVRAVIGHVPALDACVRSLHGCDYKGFFRALLGVIDLVRGDMYTHPHTRLYTREVRLVAYNQFLESYKSVTLDSMAAAFDVSPAFMDAELAGFICAGRISAKIDKVAGVIETRRPDAKNAMYLETIKRGDLLLNRVQKLSRIIDIE